MKRFLSISLVAVLLLALSVSAFADEPATAADCSVSGVWQFDSKLSLVNISIGKISVSFTSNNQSFSGLFVNKHDLSSGSMGYVSYDSKNVYSVGGWSDDAYRIVDFGVNPQSVNSAFYNWLQANATYIGLTSQPDPDPEYTHTVVIDGSSYEFTDSEVSPSVTVEVTSTGAILSSDDQSFTWTYSGDMYYDGLRSSPTSAHYLPGFSFVLGASSVDQTSTLIVVTSSVDVPDPEPEPDPEPDPDPEPEPGSYSHVVYIGSEAFTFSSSTGAPAVEIFVLPDRVRLSSGDQELFWYFDGSGEFLGIRNGSTGVLFEINAYFSLLGSSGSDKVTVFSVEFGAHELPTYWTTIYIDGTPFQFSAEGCSPDVTISVRALFVVLSDGVNSFTFEYSGAGTFTGLSFEVGADPSLPVGTVIVFEGSMDSDSSVTFYSCFESSADTDFEGNIMDWLTFIFDIFDFSGLANFITDAIHNFQTFFGLKTMLEDPAGPFAWMLS